MAKTKTAPAAEKTAAAPIPALLPPSLTDKAQASDYVKARKGKVNREEYLNRVVDALDPYYRQGCSKVGYDMVDRDQIRISVTLPTTKGRAAKKPVHGTAVEWDREAKRPTVQLWVECLIGEAEWLEVFTSVAQIMCHAAVGTAKKLNSDYQSVAQFIGLQDDAEGSQKPWSRVKPTKDFVAIVTKIHNDLGAYPHMALKIADDDTPATPTKKTITVKCDDAKHVEGPHNRASSVRVTLEDIKAFGMPKCGCGREFKAIEK